MVQYTYDAWGKLLSTTGTMASTLGAYNPLRYRSYVYDAELGLYYLQSRYYNPEVGRFLNADALVSTGQGVLGNNMFAYCGNNPVSRVDATGCAFVQIDYRYVDSLDLLCPVLGGSSCGSGAAVYAVSAAAQKMPQYTTSKGVVVSTSSYGHTQAWSGCVAIDTSGDIAVQSTLSVGESTCPALGVSVGVCQTWSTADDVQYMKGNAESVGFTLCFGYGFSVDLAWFDNPEGERDYAITIGVLLGAEVEAHGAISNTVSTKSWNPFN